MTFAVVPDRQTLSFEVLPGDEQKLWVGLDIVRSTHLDLEILGPDATAFTAKLEGNKIPTYVQPPLKAPPIGIGIDPVNEAVVIPFVSTPLLDAWADGRLQVEATATLGDVAPARPASDAPRAHTLNSYVLVPAPLPRVWGPQDMIDRHPAQMVNVLAGGEYAYRLDVVFAPDRSPGYDGHECQATLRLRAGGQHLDIPLSGRVGEAFVVLGTPGAVHKRVHQGTSLAVGLQMIVPAAGGAVVLTTTGLPQGVTCVTPDVVDANGPMVYGHYLRADRDAPLVVDVPVTIAWEVRSQKGKVAASGALVIRLTVEPRSLVVTAFAQVAAVTGRKADVYVSVTNNGPAEVVRFELEPLHGVTLAPSPAQFPVGPMSSGLAKMRFLVAPHAPVTGLGAPITARLAWRSQDRSGVTPVSLTIDNAYVMEGQQQSMWCWIAVAVSTATYYNHGQSVQTQCQVASRFSEPAGSIPCCGSQASSSACNHGGYASDAMGALGLQWSVHGVVSESDLLQQIDLCRPVLVILAPPSGSLGHLIAVTGYTVDAAGTRSWVVEDPAGPSQSVMSYASLHTYNGWTWAGTYFTDAPA